MFNDKFEEIGKCSVTGLSLKQKKSWKIEDDDYFAHPYLIAETIFIINSKGRPLLSSVKKMIDIFEDARKISNLNQLIVISNQKHVKAISAEGRRLYIEHIRKYNGVVGAIFYNTHKITKISLNLGMSFVNTKVILAIEDNYEDSIFKAFQILSGHKNKKYKKKNKLKSIAKDYVSKMITTSNIVLNKNRENIVFEYELNLLKNFLLNIDWNKESKYNMEKYEKSPFSMIYQAIIFIKSELDNLIKKIHLQQKELEDLNMNLENKIIDRTIDLKRINENLEEAKLLAESASKAKDIFLANISHELKTPMNAILGYSSVAIRKIEQIDKEKEKYYFERINESVKRLIKLWEDLINIAKLETLDIKYNLKRVNLLSILNESINSLDYRLKEKNIKLNIIKNESKSYFLNIDSNKIRQSIDNILTNAIKFTKNNTSIDICLTRKENSIVIKFKDEGIGLNNSELFKIFDTFYQSDRTSNSIIKGTGLGLSISKKIISAHNGKIWANNRIDGITGSIFTIELPIEN